MQPPPPPAEPFLAHSSRAQQPLLTEEPFLPFHSISDQALVRFSPKNVFVQILVKYGDFLVWEMIKKNHPQYIRPTQQ